MNNELHPAPSVPPCAGREGSKASASQPSVALYGNGGESAIAARQTALRAVFSRGSLTYGLRFDSGLHTSGFASGIDWGQVTRKQIGKVLRLLPIAPPQSCGLSMRDSKRQGPTVYKPNYQRQMTRDGVTYMVHPVAQCLCSLKALPVERVSDLHSVIRIAVKRCLGAVFVQVGNCLGEESVSKANLGAYLKKDQQTLRVTFSCALRCLVRCNLHCELSGFIGILAELDRRSSQLIRAPTQAQGRDAQKDCGCDGYDSYPNSPRIPPNVALRPKRPALVDSLQHAHFSFPLWVSADSAMEAGRA